MNTNYQVIKTEESFAKQLNLSAHQAIGLDTETTELDPYTGRLRLIQLATPDGVHIIDLDAFRRCSDLRNTPALDAAAQSAVGSASDQDRAQRKV